MRVRKFQDRRSGIWHLKWWEGKERKFKSTGLTDKPLAEIRRSAKERELVLAESAETIRETVERIVEARLQSATQALFARLPGGDASSTLSGSRPAVQQVTATSAGFGFLRYLRATKRRSPDYIRDVGRQLRMFLAHAKIEWLGDITPTHVSRYIGSLSGAGKTAENKLVIIRSWLTWCVEIKECLLRNPAQKIEGPALAPLDVKVNTAREALKILERLSTLDDPRPAAWLATAFYAGLRRGELRYAQVDLAGRSIRVANTREKDVKTKRRSRTIPIVDELLPYLNRLPRVSDNFFGIKKDLGHMSTKVGDLCAAAGLTEGGFQVARHSYCVHLRLNGVNEYLACEWSGHSSQVFREYYNGYLLGMEPLPMHWYGLNLLPHGLPEIPILARRVGGS